MTTLRGGANRLERSKVWRFWMFFIPAYPFWSLTIIAMDVVPLWGLCAYGSRQNLAASDI